MMDASFKLPPSPGTPLFQMSPESENQQRHSPSKESLHSRTHSRDSSVHEKVAAFNTLAMQSKQLERQVSDAALKRAVLGREEAESEMRRWRNEAESLKKHLEESERQKSKVSERIEAYIEKYASAKHKLALSSKEIKRVEKDYYKLQSELVEIQEELQSSRATLKTAQGELTRERERSAKREQEAFAARYELVGVQEELQEMLQRVKLVEQERDALRTIAKNEEIARIAAEGQLPLPVSPENDEFASPKKARRSSALITITSSAATEEELEGLKMLLEWETRRANRAQDLVEFLETECQQNCCPAAKTRDERPVSPHRASTLEIKTEPLDIPPEAVLRPVSHTVDESPWISPAKKSVDVDVTISKLSHQPIETLHYSRTPSVDPPVLAMLHDNNTSLLSLLDGPQSPVPEPIVEEQENVQKEEQQQEQEKKQAEEQEQESERDQDLELDEDKEDAEADTTVVNTFHTVYTTTRIPLANTPDLTPRIALTPNFENSALSPTVSREEALAMIRERRGRARSLAQGTLTPRKQMVDTAIRRDISAPAIRSGNIRGRSQARA